MTSTRGKKPPVEPGLIPAPGGLLDWHEASYFVRWQDRRRPAARRGLADGPPGFHAYPPRPMTGIGTRDYPALTGTDT
ncbi:hypothetical protein ACIOGT_37670 [Streptomyces microflavus]|uniref:hypothetical protein n=1 Tax=Streptomyces microflavus TaxID=1919 RepID=UPI00380C32CD